MGDMTNFFYFTLLLLFSNAQSGAPNLSDVETISRQGNLFSIQIVKGEPIRIYVVGKERAQLDLSTIAVDLSLDPSDMSVAVKPKKVKSSRLLKLTQQNNYFIMENPADGDRVYKLEVKSKSDGKTETFNFKLKNKLP